MDYPNVMKPIRIPSDRSCTRLRATNYCQSNLTARSGQHIEIRTGGQFTIGSTEHECNEDRHISFSAEQQQSGRLCGTKSADVALFASESKTMTVTYRSIYPQDQVILHAVGKRLWFVDVILMLM